MTQKYVVRGFRSLKRFQIELTPGLNVAVGTNGAGKTNFVAFLDFLSALVSSGLHAAFASAHGAPAAFSREQQQGNYSVLSFTVSAPLNDFEESEYLRNHFKSEIALEPSGYQYYCAIRYSRSLGIVHIAEERLRIKFKNCAPFRVRRKTSVSHQLSTPVTVITSESPDHPLVATLKDRYRSEKVQSAGDFLSSLTEDLDGQTPVLMILTVFYSIRSIVRQLSGSRSINIDPLVSKKPTPVTSDEEFSRDGSGLSGNLFMLQNDRLPGRFWMRNENAGQAKLIFDRISSWVREANAQIVSLIPKQDHDDATFKVDVVLGENRAIMIPLTAISDGTVKWIALVTTLSIAEDLIVIEEPENFLHPRMQEVFVQLCRSLIDDRGSRQTILVTTHSETILNACDPSELIMFTYSDRGTECTRPKNVAQVRDLIRESRFKLGHFYKVGTLDGTNSGNS